MKVAKLEIRYLLLTCTPTTPNLIIDFWSFGTVHSAEGKPVLEDKLPEVASSLIAAYDSGELRKALEEGHAGWQKWVKSFGKLLKRKVSHILYDVGNTLRAFYPIFLSHSQMNILNIMFPWNWRCNPEQ